LVKFSEELDHILRFYTKNIPLELHYPVENNNKAGWLWNPLFSSKNTTLSTIFLILLFSYHFVESSSIIQSGSCMDCYKKIFKFLHYFNDLSRNTYIISARSLRFSRKKVIIDKIQYNTKRKTYCLTYIRPRKQLKKSNFNENNQMIIAE